MLPSTFSGRKWKALSRVKTRGAIRHNAATSVGGKIDNLRGLGIGLYDKGVHSIRKGAGTFASSGTTAAPSSVSVNNRGGSNLRGLRDVYMLTTVPATSMVDRI